MRIFYAAVDSTETSFASSLWRGNLYMTLAGLGHDMVEFGYDLRDTFSNLNPADPEKKRFIDANRPRLSAELLRQIRKAHAERPVDLFFSYFYDACVLPEAVDEIRSLGIKTVNWYCNGSYQLDLVREISPHYDWCLVPERFRLADYRAMGANPVYCQEAANPDIYRPYGLPAGFDVTFVGQAYGDRPEYIRYLLDRGIGVRVWGFGWDNFPPPTPAGRVKRAARLAGWLATPEGLAAAGRRAGAAVSGGDPDGLFAPPGVRPYLPPGVAGGVLSDEELVKTFSRSKINLGFSSCGNTHKGGERILQVRLRDFEVPMSGGFYMVEYMEELEEFFEIGREVVCYKGMKDLAGKIRYYLAHDSERESIRKAGRERCLRDHTWRKRFTDAFREMGLAGR